MSNNVCFPHEWVLPQHTELGALNLGDVFLYYDMPLLFSCFDSDGQIYLGLAEEFEDGVGE